MEATDFKQVNDYQSLVEILKRSLKAKHSPVVNLSSIKYSEANHTYVTFKEDSTAPIPCRHLNNEIFKLNLKLKLLSQQILHFQKGTENFIVLNVQISILRSMIAKLDKVKTWLLYQHVTACSSIRPLFKVNIIENWHIVQINGLHYDYWTEKFSVLKCLERYNLLNLPS